MSSITSSTMPFLETLNGLIEPLLFIGLSLSYVPSTISQVFRERRLVSWDQFQFLWFGNFWRTVGPMVRDGAEARVVPLLQGRVRLGTAVPPDGDSRGLPPGVGGTVIEVGPGSGMWVSIYGDQYATLSDTVDKSIPGKRTRVEKVFGIEPNATHHAALQSRISEAGLDGSYTIVPVGIEDIGSTGLIPKGSVDAIVTVLCLCSIPEPEKNIRELYEYLKPGGRWFVYEHVKCYASQGNFMRWYQSRSTPSATSDRRTSECRLAAVLGRLRIVSRHRQVAPRCWALEGDRPCHAHRRSLVVHNASLVWHLDQALSRVESS